jgi:MFS family permease
MDINAYVIVFGALLLLGGRLSDIVGQKKIFIIGFLTLTIASVIAGHSRVLVQHSSLPQLLISCSY